MNTKQQEAQRLYFTHSYSPWQIAGMVGVTERAVYYWIRQHSWDALRTAALQAPALIAENLCSQIVELQNEVAAREPGKRYPTAAEAEVTRKLIVCLDKMKNNPSLSQSTQVMTSFRSFVRANIKDKSTAQDICDWTCYFLEGSAKNGYHPYQVEYGGGNISPFDPLNDLQPYELTEEELKGTEEASSPAQPVTPPRPYEEKLKNTEDPLKRTEELLQPVQTLTPLDATEEPLKNTEDPLKIADDACLISPPPGGSREGRSEDREGLPHPTEEILKNTENSLKRTEGTWLPAPSVTPPPAPGTPRIFHSREQMTRISEELKERYGILPGMNSGTDDAAPVPAIPVRKRPRLL